MHSNSLWANYFRAKYIGQRHISDVQFRNMSGFARRSWLKAKTVVVQFKKIIVGDGMVTNFWYDTWIGNQCLANFVPANSIPNSNISVKEFLTHASTEELNLLNRFIPAPIKRAITNTILTQDYDIQVWSLSSSGRCSVASTYHFLSDSIPSQTTIQWERLWSQWLPTKISVHLWKTLQNCLPVDSNVQRLGVSLCSRCS